LWPAATPLNCGSPEDQPRVNAAFRSLATGRYPARKHEDTTSPMMSTTSAGQGNLTLAPASRGGPFDPAEHAAYRIWRAAKLDRAPASLEELAVDIADPARLTADERSALVERIGRANMAVYRCRGAAVDRDALRRFGQVLGLQRLDEHLCAEEDGISQLRVSEAAQTGEYIPYTDRPLSWHCDGYYNESERMIRAMLLHCVSDAAEGGENALMDHEMLYIGLRDAGVEYVEALMHPQALTIPANVQDGVEIRPERTGPVFSVDPATGALHMRYTARGRNIRWRDDRATAEAVALIGRILGAPDAPVFRYRLQPGEGIVCNNVLHNRTGFRDDPDSGRQRLIYRARFLDRVAET
jgi:alpha-ketoglutarate-dependent taurine dioxygenase